jgi:CspA family cold shock protein
METGTIITLHVDRGFGFIYHQRGGADLFFHANELVDLEFNEQLKERRVQFEIRQTPKGPRAYNVTAAN